MSSSHAEAPNLGVSAFADRVSSRTASARLMPVEDGFARFGPELARLARLAGPSTAMTFSPAWWQAVPPPRGYAHRLLVLHTGEELCAAVSLRERTLLGLPTGLLQGSDAKGEAMVLCPPGEEVKWLVAGIEAVFGSRRCAALHLSCPQGAEKEEMGDQLNQAGLQQRTLPARAFWRTVLAQRYDDTLVPFGRRTRRNLRHALRRVAQNGWQFLPELTAAQVADATTSLSTRSTHPYSRRAIAARLELETSHRNSFSMGLRSPKGEWLSMMSGVRRSEGVTDIFWQANVASGHDSLAITMRALLMRHEGERGAVGLRFIGGTSPLMEHCCVPDPAQQTLITRPGLKLALLRLVMKTPLASPVNPLRKLLELPPL